MCSVPDHDEMLRRLYALMKLGGQFLVSEHVKSKDVASIMVQSMFVLSLIVPLRWWRSQRADLGIVDLYNIFWPLFNDLNRNSQRFIMQAGDWGKIELTGPTSEDAWAMFPRIYDRFWKKQWLLFKLCTLLRSLLAQSRHEACISRNRCISCLELNTRCTIF